MVSQHDTLDYPTVTKRGIALGIGLFLIGALGQVLIHTTGLQVPAWEQSLLFDFEVLGILIMVFSAFVFGIIMPLTE